MALLQMMPIDCQHNEKSKKNSPIGIAGAIPTTSKKVLLLLLQEALLARRSCMGGLRHSRCTRARAFPSCGSGTSHQAALDPMYQTQLLRWMAWSYGWQGPKIPWESRIHHLRPPARGQAKHPPQRRASRASSGRREAYSRCP